MNQRSNLLYLTNGVLYVCSVAYAKVCSKKKVDNFIFSVYDNVIETAYKANAKGSWLVILMRAKLS